MLCKLEGDKYSCSYLRKGQGRITDTTRLGSRAAQFMGQSPTLSVFYRQLICISYASWVMQKERVTPSAPAFTSHYPHSVSVYLASVRSRYYTRRAVVDFKRFSLGEAYSKIIRFKQLEMLRMLHKAAHPPI